MRRVLLVIGVVLVVILGAWLLIPNKNSGNKDIKAVRPMTLPDYASTDAVVSMTINGPVVALEQHWVVKVDVSRMGRTLKIIRGYEGSIEKQQDYINNQPAFSTFLFALNSAGFTAKKLAPVGATEQGSCPQGERFVYEIYEGDKQKQHLWTTSCTKNLGTFNGSNSLSQSLFKAQIPDYNKTTSGLSYQ